MSCIIMGIIVMIIALNSLVVLYDWLSLAVTFSENPASWGMQEFLINYQGGFVRRGLLGEILYQIASITWLDPRYFVVPFCVACCALYVVILCIISYKEKCILWCIPTMYGLCGAALIRKDYLIMLCVAAAFWLYGKISPPLYRVGLVMLLSGVVVCIHEGFFFILCPIMMMLLFFDADLKIGLPVKFVIVFLYLGLVASICVCKGDAATAEIIYHSWQFIYPNEYATYEPCSVIGALHWGIGSAIRFHLLSNFYSGPVPYAGAFLRPLAWLVIFVLLTRGSAVISSRFCGGYIQTRKMVFFALIQFCALLPLLSFMGCDFARFVFFWTSSTVFAYFFLKHVTFTFPDWLLVNGGFNRLNSWLERIKSPMFIMSVVAIFSIPELGNEWSSYISPFVRFMMKYCG